MVADKIRSSGTYTRARTGLHIYITHRENLFVCLIFLVVVCGCEILVAVCNCLLWNTPPSSFAVVVVVVVVVVASVVKIPL